MTTTFTKEQLERRIDDLEEGLKIQYEVKDEFMDNIDVLEKENADLKKKVAELMEERQELIDDLDVEMEGDAEMVEEIGDLKKENADLKKEVVDRTKYDTWVKEFWVYPNLEIIDYILYLEKNEVQYAKNKADCESMIAGLEEGAEDSDQAFREAMDSNDELEKEVASLKIQLREGAMEPNDLVTELKNEVAKLKATNLDIVATLHEGMGFHMGLVNRNNELLEKIEELEEWDLLQAEFKRLAPEAGCSISRENGIEGAREIVDYLKMEVSN